MKFKYFLKEILKGKTIGRALLFSSLKELFEEEEWLNNSFSVLEIGSEPASHQRAFPKTWRLTVSNFVLMKNIDLVIDAEKKFPVESGEFEGVVLFNVLYVIDNYKNCLEESLRVSRKFVMFNIPLISGIARHPKDFNRFTEDRLLEVLNYLKDESKPDNYQIIPLGGSFSAALTLIDPFLKFRLIRIPLYLLAISLDKLDKIINRQCPIQYLVLIKK